jgi:hypothetical protein
MSSNPAIDPRDLVEYDPETGEFRWLFTRGKLRAGMVAGYKFKKTGYITIMVNWKRMYAHRLAWYFVYNEWPNGHIDHINRNTSDNRICNLRVVDNSHNQRNRKIAAHNKSGITGIWFSKKENKWEAYITIRRKRTRLGRFSEKADAIAARKAAEKENGWINV